LRAGRAAAELARDVLPLFLPTQRWFAAKDRAIADAQVENAATLPAPAGGQGDGWRLLLLKVAFTDGQEQRYFLPLGLAWGAPTTEPIAQLMPQTLAHVRRFRAEGTLFDAAGQDVFILAVLRAMAEGRDLAAENGGKISFRATPAYAGVAWPENPAVKRLGGEQSNTSVLIDEAAIFKSYRQMHAGIHPEVELMAYLTAKAPEVAIPPLLGTIGWTLPHGEPMAAGILMGFVRNQGDAWIYTREHLKRSFQDSLHAPPAAPGEPKERSGLHHALYLEIAGQLGRRTAELHRALCRADETDPAFAPEPITAADLEAWLQTILVQAEVVFNDLRLWQATHADAEPATLADVRRLLELAPELRQRAQRITIDRLDAVKTRYHGDLHLGQVLVKQNDVVLIDFEGEPRRSLEERRSKHSALKDVAGVIRSFDYAAAAAGRTVAELPAVQLTDFQKFCAEWRILAEQKFLERYRETIDGCPVWPRDSEAAADLLNLLILDKAVYEIGYEIANRPNWVGIPVQAVVELLQAPRPGR